MDTIPLKVNGQWPVCVYLCVWLFAYFPCLTVFYLLPLQFILILFFAFDLFLLSAFYLFHGLPFAA